ncbi:MAG: hypothetical protein ACT4O9_07605 [Blastocatellia bacterium]
MVKPQIIRESLSELIAAHFEWLAVRENGTTIPLQNSEIEITVDEEKTLIGFVDQKGFSVWRVETFDFEDSMISVKVTSRFRSDPEVIEFHPRESAAELSANIELARLEKANEIARIVVESVAEAKLLRVALNADNGRIAQITIEKPDKVKAAVLSDVTSSLTHETILASAIKWLDELRSRRKNPIDEVWIAADKRQARNLQKLLALLNAGTKSGIEIIEIVRKKEPPTAKNLRRLKFPDLWREKPAKLIIPPTVEPSETAQKIIEMAPEKIDRIFSKQGETLRFLGLPFARVRRIMGREKAWFGVSRNRVVINESAKRAFRELRNDLELHRRTESPNRRHDLYRLAPEAWLESILRRNIKLLDANLILSPIYNQFRSSNDKIDLLAIRKDGRLVIIELKTSPDREMIFQAADYWRKIELQRRRGVLAEAKLFGDLEILDKSALVFAVAPALSFHRDFDYFARTLCSDIELWRWELHEDWRREIKVLQRRTF